MMHATARRLSRIALAAVALLLNATVVQAQTTDEGSSGPVFPYILALLFTILVMVIVCMPSRKS